jgi:hypothetical protein
MGNSLRFIEALNTSTSHMAKLISRIIWQLNRSPLRKLIKLTVRLANIGVVRRRTALARGLPKISEIDGVVSQLKVDGYCILTDLVDKELLQKMATSSKERLASAESSAQHQSETSKPFWVRLLDEEMEDGKIRISSPYIRFAIQPLVMQIISRALGQIPRLDYVLLTLSRYSPKSFDKSQLWHLDHDDVQVIKLFVYLTDVEDLNDGPFTFIPAAASGALGYSLRSHRNDEEVFGSGRIAAEDVKSIIAPALSVFMVDTARCLHMGSRLSEGHQRLLYTATYTSAPSMFLGYRKERFIYDVEFESEVEKKVLAD